ncbi:MAG: 3-dehydroquinate synthase [Lachnospirales bacterium]
MDTKKIEVSSSNSTYNIYLGGSILNLINKKLNPNSRKVIITDENIYRLKLCKQLNVDNLIDTIVIQSGENNKSFATVQSIIQRLTELQFSRDDVLIAFGGGIVGDVCGFVASIYMRGIKYVQVPTTLLSMVDSSIGGKTAINFSDNKKIIKNLVGSFYTPEFVIIDKNLLETLPERQLKCGMVEMIKIGFIYNKQIVEIFENQRDFEALDELIYLAVMTKKEIVEIDEKEKGLRKILNFGHTFGHGLETVSENKILHGEAVAFGMTKMIKNDNVLNRLVSIFNKYKIPYVFEYNKENILKTILLDKKSTFDDEIFIVFVDEVGKGYIEQVQHRTLALLLK